MRVAVGGISHETNTFSSIRTDLAAFQRRTLIRRDALIEASRGVSNALGGIIDTATALGWSITPTVFASAVPSGRIRRSTFETLTTELVTGIAEAMRDDRSLDGVVLALHGAMVTEAIEDADGEILRRVRNAIGPAIPIAVVFDFHANLTPAITHYADLVVGYDTYPHVDTYARGSEVVRLLERLRRREIQPVHHLRQMPMLIPLPAQWTDGPTPMRDITNLAQRLEGTPGVINIMVAAGFPYSDIHDAGFSILVTTDGDRQLAERVATELSAAIWERRDDFRPDLTPVSRAVDIARSSSAACGPIVLADVADNPGAGASSDGTAILEALLNAHLEGVAVGVIADPTVVRQAAAIGPGSAGTFKLGGKTDRLHGPTLTVDAFVRSVADVAFINQGPMGTGALTRLGHTAVLEIGHPPVEVIVTTNRVQVLDPQLFRAVGITPEQRRVLVVKSSVHFRAAFEPIASVIVEVDAPGLSSPDLGAFPYRRVRRPIWPLDRYLGSGDVTRASSQ